MAAKKDNLPLSLRRDDDPTGTITYANEVIAIIAGVAANEVEGIAGMLSAAIPDFRVLGPAPGDADSAPHILYAAFPPVRAETMVHALEVAGVFVGTGSACSSHKQHRSETLTAMHIPPATMDSAIRLSFSVQNTPEEIRYAVQKMIEQYRLLARFTRR